MAAMQVNIGHSPSGGVLPGPEPDDADGCRFNAIGPAPIESVAVDDSGMHVAAVDQRGNVFVFDLESNQYFRAQNATLPAPLALWSRSRTERLVLGMSDATVRCYDVVTGDMVESLALHKQALHSLSQDADGGLLLTASPDAAALWSTRDWSRLRTLGPTGTSGPLVAAAFAPGAGHIAVAFADDSVMVWSVASFGRVAKLLLPPEEAGARLRCVAASADGTLVVGGSARGFLYVWDVPSQAAIRIVDMPPPSGGVKQVAVIHPSVAAQLRARIEEGAGGVPLLSGADAGSAGGEAGQGPPPAPQLVALDASGRLLIIDLQPAQPAAIYEVEAPLGIAGGRVATFALSDNARTLALTTDDGRLVVFDLPLAVLRHLQSVRSTATGTSGTAASGERRQQGQGVGPGAARGAGGGSSGGEEEEEGSSLVAQPLSAEAAAAIHAQAAGGAGAAGVAGGGGGREAGSLAERLGLREQRMPGEAPGQGQEGEAEAEEVAAAGLQQQLQQQLEYLEAQEARLRGHEGTRSAGLTAAAAEEDAWEIEPSQQQQQQAPGRLPGAEGQRRYAYAAGAGGQQFEAEAVAGEAGHDAEGRGGDEAYGEGEGEEEEAAIAALQGEAMPTFPSGASSLSMLGGGRGVGAAVGQQQHAAGAGGEEYTGAGAGDRSGTSAGGGGGLDSTGVSSYASGEAPPPHVAGGHPRQEQRQQRQQPPQRQQRPASAGGGAARVSAHVQQPPPAAGDRPYPPAGHLREGQAPGVADPAYVARRQRYADGFGGRDRGAGAALHSMPEGQGEGDGSGSSGGRGASPAVPAARYAAEAALGLPPAAAAAAGVAAGTAGGLRPVRILPQARPAAAGPPPLHQLVASALALPVAGLHAAARNRAAATAAVIGTHARIRVMVARHGSLPAKYRPQAWRFALRLPANAPQFADVAAAGPHHAWADLAARYPVKDRRLMGRLAGVCSALAHWSPVFGQAAFLPAFAFPWVKFFGSVAPHAAAAAPASAGAAGGAAAGGPAAAAAPGADMTTFEAVATLLLNWGRHFVEALPHPPLPLLARLHVLLRHWDAPLATHLEACGVDATRYGWPLLRSCLSEVLVRGEWEALWDALLAQHAHDPSMLLYAVVAYLRYTRAALLCVKPDSAAPLPHPGAAFGAGGACPLPLAASGQPGFPVPAAGAQGHAVSTACEVLCATLRRQTPVHLPSILRLAREMRGATPLWAHPYPVAEADRLAVAGAAAGVPAAAAGSGGTAASTVGSGGGGGSSVGGGGAGAMPAPGAAVGSGSTPTAAAPLRRTGPAPTGTSQGGVTAASARGWPGHSQAMRALAAISTAAPASGAAGTQAGALTAASLQPSEAALLGLPDSGPVHPLPPGAYPPFLTFPRAVVDHGIAVRDRIAREEAALAAKRGAAAALQEAAARLAAEEEAWRAQQALAAAAECRAAAETRRLTVRRQADAAAAADAIAAQRQAAIAQAQTAAGRSLAAQRSRQAALAAAIAQEAEDAAAEAEAWRAARAREEAAAASDARTLAHLGELARAAQDQEAAASSALAAVQRRRASAASAAALSEAWAGQEEQRRVAREGEVAAAAAVGRALSAQRARAAAELAVAAGEAERAAAVAAAARQRRLRHAGEDAETGLRSVLAAVQTQELAQGQGDGGGEGGGDGDGAASAAQAIRAAREEAADFAAAVGHVADAAAARNAALLGSALGQQQRAHAAAAAGAAAGTGARVALAAHAAALDALTATSVRAPLQAAAAREEAAAAAEGAAIRTIAASAAASLRDISNAAVATAVRSHRLPPEATLPRGAGGLQYGQLQVPVAAAAGREWAGSVGGGAATAPSLLGTTSAAGDTGTFRTALGSSRLHAGGLQRPAPSGGAYDGSQAVQATSRPSVQGPAPSRVMRPRRPSAEAGPGVDGAYEPAGAPPGEGGGFGSPRRDLQGAGRAGYAGERGYEYAEGYADQRGHEYAAEEGAEGQAHGGGDAETDALALGAALVEREAAILRQQMDALAARLSASRTLEQSGRLLPSGGEPPRGGEGGASAGAGAGGSAGPQLPHGGLAAVYTQAGARSTPRPTAHPERALPQRQPAPSPAAAAGASAATRAGAASTSATPLQQPAHARPAAPAAAAPPSAVPSTAAPALAARGGAGGGAEGYAGSGSRRSSSGGGSVGERDPFAGSQRVPGVGFGAVVEGGTQQLSPSAGSRHRGLRPLPDAPSVQSSRGRGYSAEEEEGAAESPLEEEEEEDWALGGEASEGEGAWEEEGAWGEEGRAGDEGLEPGLWEEVGEAGGSQRPQEGWAGGLQQQGRQPQRQQEPPVASVEASITLAPGGVGGRGRVVSGPVITVTRQAGPRALSHRGADPGSSAPAGARATAAAAAGRQAAGGAALQRQPQPASHRGGGGAAPAARTQGGAAAAAPVSRPGGGGVAGQSAPVGSGGERAAAAQRGVGASAAAAAPPAAPAARPPAAAAAPAPAARSGEGREHRALPDRPLPDRPLPSLPSASTGQGSSAQSGAAAHQRGPSAFGQEGRRLPQGGSETGSGSSGSSSASGSPPGSQAETSSSADSSYQRALQRVGLASRLAASAVDAGMAAGAAALAAGAAAETLQAQGRQQHVAQGVRGQRHGEGEGLPQAGGTTSGSGSPSEWYTSDSSSSSGSERGGPSRAREAAGPGRSSSGRRRE